jgi:hypothetical protein
LKGGGGAGPDGMREGAGGAVGLVGAGLFSWERLSALPFPFSSPDGPLTPLEIGYSICHCHIFSCAKYSPLALQQLMLVPPPYTLICGNEGSVNLGLYT